MKTLHALSLNRDDLGEPFKATLINEIQIMMFPFFATGVVLYEDLIVFIDEDGTSRILKNRLGKAQNG
jgi:hypothetical protein